MAVNKWINCLHRSLTKTVYFRIQNNFVIAKKTDRYNYANLARRIILYFNRKISETLMYMYSVHRTRNSKRMNLPYLSNISKIQIQASLLFALKGKHIVNFTM